MERTSFDEAFWAAEKARQAMCRERDEMIAKAREPHLLASYEAGAAVEAAYKDRVRKAYDDEEAARQARDANRIERAQSMTFGVFPVGTRIERTVKSYRSWGPETTERGIVEIWTIDSVSPDNLNHWRHPDYGELVVRLLRKDGTPGKKFYRAGGYRTPDPSTWTAVKEDVLYHD